MTTPRELLARYVSQSELSTLYTDRMGILNVKSYGATGDGATDDTDAIQTAIDAAEENSGGTIFLPRGTYKITSTLTIDGSEIHFMGDGRFRTTIDASALAADTYAIIFSGSEGSEYSIAAASEGDASVTMTTAAQASNFAAGDVVRIASDDVFSLGKCGECGIVEKINATTGVVSLRWKLFDDYTTAPVISKVSMLSNVSLCDLTVAMSSADAAYTALKFDRVERFLVDGIGIKYGRKEGLYLLDCMSGAVKNCHIEESWYTGTNTSYGIVMAGAAQFIVVDGNHITRARHCVAHGSTVFRKGIPRMVLCCNNHLVSSGKDPDGDGSNEITAPYCLDCHADSEFIEFSHNTCVGGGIDFNGQKSVASNNTIIRAADEGIRIDNTLYGCKIVGNQIFNPASIGLFVPDNYALVDCLVDGNLIRSPSGVAICINTGVENCSLSNNTIIDGASHGIQIRAMGTLPAGVTLQNLKMTGNTIVGNTGNGIALVAGYAQVLVEDNLLQGNADPQIYGFARRGMLHRFPI